MKVTVLVPTYRRTADLVRCLLALRQQERSCDEVVVVARSEDDATLTCLGDRKIVEGLPLNVVLSDVPGQVAALNRGLEAASGDVIAITDDDAAPHADWTRRIVTAFEADPCLGAIGGRDWMHLKGRLVEGERPIVGKITCFGKVIGNHHLGVGEPREVDVLKGANMSYRREAVRNIRFDTRLRGTGAQVHNDMAFSMSVKKAGWRLVYDPQIAVDHFPAERFDEDRRDVPTLAAICNAAFNLHLTLRGHLSPLHRGVVWWWYMLVGTRAYPGCVHAFLALLSEERSTKLARWRAVRMGAREARCAFARNGSTGTGKGMHA
ncbi:glycosyltransferase [Paraburkholderia sp. LEh10]|uniref:glycosyltransferase n=1 Tax=Paraburkholderia sp. LEh10 TaxID=2821353 RepID=UPI001AE1A0C8|nr:glycosyltransferase [Paraburkholderia sp. LEh10]MBP0596186.1 glycosyltransferase [Paraburkholderia sp. LEh10]